LRAGRRPRDTNAARRRDSPKRRGTRRNDLCASAISGTRTASCGRRRPDRRVRADLGLAAAGHAVEQEARVRARAQRRSPAPVAASCRRSGARGERRQWATLRPCGRHARIAEPAPPPRACFWAGRRIPGPPGSAAASANRWREISRRSAGTVAATGLEHRRHRHPRERLDAERSAPRRARQ
jgi:hypothetical protein